MPTTRQEHPASMAPLDEAGLRELILEIIDENHLMCVATVRSDGWPHATLVNYLRLGRALYFVIARESQKFANITQDSRVSIALGGGLITNGAVRGLSMAARAIEIGDPARIEEINKAIFRQSKTAGFRPHPSSVLVAVMEARPSVISVVDYTVPPGRRDLVQAVEDWRIERIPPRSPS
ncbi:MAG: pyridoxamine 5'-phosphate oxidase family protein [Phenylobacterium sp.]|nr:pyridoxamine 5'-phosphate oxidase family protein [Phenylobacterium sp.]